MNRIYDFLSGLGLQYKFILITTLAIILTMSSLGYWAVEREKSIMHAEVEKQGRLLGDILTIPIINDLIYERLGLVEEGGLLDNYILEIYNKQDVDLLYIAILDIEGRVISHNDITEYGKLYTDAFTQKAIWSEETVIEYRSDGEHNVLDFGVPLLIGKEEWGTLMFRISLEKVENEIHATIKRIIIFTVLLLAAGFAVILLLSRRFIQPITRLAGIMEKTRGDYLNVRVEVSGHDELAVLGERFNSMIERIKQANEELKKTHEKLARSEKLASIGILVAGVAHEINNPLGGLFNCIQILRQNPDNKELREKYLAFIMEGLTRIESTVSKLLWISKKQEHNPVVVDIGNAVDSVYSFVEYQLRNKNIIFEKDVTDGLQIVIDLHDFQQMLLNLFINAIHAIEERGRLEVRGYKEGTVVKIEVKDSGCGIEHEDIGRIFDPFFTTKPTGQGTGLGLWLTYDIVKSYGGEIFVESVINEGTKFILSFPDGT